VILRARDADRPRLVLGGQDAFDDVDERGDAELLPPVWPPGSSSIVWPVTRIGALTVALKLRGR